MLAEARAVGRKLGVAGGVLDAFNVAPGIILANTRGQAAAGAAFALQVVLTFVLPYVGTMLVNSTQFASELGRRIGAVDRNRKLVDAPTLATSLADLRATTRELEAALEHGGDVRGALDSALQAYEKRHLRKAFDDTYNSGRKQQSLAAGARQLSLFGAQFLSMFAQDKDCLGGQDAFRYVVGMVVLWRAVQALQAAPADEVATARKDVIGMLGHTDFADKDDVRDGWRSAEKMRYWMAGDLFEGNIDRAAGQLAALLGVRETDLRAFDAAGGFCRAPWTRALDAAERQRLAGYRDGQEGPPVAGAATTIAALGKLVVLESLTQPRDPSTAVADSAGPPRFTEAEIGQTLGIDPERVARLRGGSLCDDLQRDLAALIARHDDRTSLQPGHVVDISRVDLLDRTQLARRENAPLDAVGVAVRDRLEARAKTSSLNLRGWNGGPPLPAHVDAVERRSATPQETAHDIEWASRRERSLTPLEHALLMELRVRPRVEQPAGEAHPHPLTDHDTALASEACRRVAAALAAHPERIAAARPALDRLRASQLDRALLSHEWNRLGAGSTQIIDNLLLGRRSLLGNVRDVSVVRARMKPFVVPPVVAQYGRAFFLGIGGPGLSYLVTWAASLLRRAHPQYGECTPGQGHTELAEHFSQILLYVSAVQLGIALVGCWSGPHAVNNARARREYFDGKSGPLSTSTMIRKALSTAFTDDVWQRVGVGPRAERQARLVIGRATRALESMADVRPGSAADPAAH